VRRSPSERFSRASSPTRPTLRSVVVGDVVETLGRGHTPSGHTRCNQSKYTPTGSNDMAENTKMPPNQDQRQRTPQGDMNKPQKPGGAGSGSTVSDPDRGRQGTGGPNRPMPDMDQDRSRTERGRPNQDPTQEPDKNRVTKVDNEDEIEDLDDADTTQTQRQDRGGGGGIDRQ
jgi:hypothetical protein